MNKQRYINLLGAKCACKRLSAIKKIKKASIKAATSNEKRESVNIQIHTRCSFSPYTPSLAAYMAYKFNLRVAGIMDNYTLSGAKEFIKACKILGLTYTVGVELRANFPFENQKQSNVAVCGVAARFIKPFDRELAFLRENQRSNSLSSLEAVNRKLKKHNIALAFKKDVLKSVPREHDTHERVFLSKYVYQALGEKLIESFKKGSGVADFLKNSLNMQLSESEYGLLCDENNPYYLYDLVNIIFENSSVFYAKKNYAEADKVVALAHKYGAICAYELVIRERLENTSDDRVLNIIKELSTLKELGFDAVAFDGNKLSASVREVVFKKLRELEMLTLALSRVEFPRRKFDVSFPDETTKKLMTDSSFAIVGSEMCENLTGDGLISSSKLKIDSFEEKVALFAKIGRKGV